MSNKNPEIAIISDLHFGVHGDSERWHRIMIDYAKWLGDLLFKRKTVNLYILGDVFDNRKAVGVETMQMAHDFFEILMDKMGEIGLGVTIIAGNHDSFYEDTAKTSSVSLFSAWPGINLISDKPEEIVWGSACRLLCCPWGTDMRALAEQGKTWDVIMGHFAISSFADVPGHLYTGGYTPEEITACSPLVFSGHFHLRDDKKFKFGGKEKRIVIVGSPYQLNWADAGSVKGVYFFNPLTKDIDFMENTASPKHVQINVGDEISRDAIQNNIVRVVANSVDEAKQVQSFISGLKDLGAVDIGAKIAAVDASLPETFVAESVGEFDQHKLLVDYIEACDFGDKKEKVMEIMERLYNTAVAAQKESI